jgi:hypothetical protein
LQNPPGRSCAACGIALDRFVNGTRRGADEIASSNDRPLISIVARGFAAATEFGTLLMLQKAGKYAFPG